MKLRGVHFYIAGFILAVTIGFYVNMYMGFVIAGALYAILMGLILSIFNINTIDKSIYDKRKKID